MRVLIACEYSGIVSTAFRHKGHDVTSCDLLPSEARGQHYQGNVFDIITEKWDLLIAHPPCTYICNAGLNWINREAGRKEKQAEAIDFVRRLFASPVLSIAIENPKGIMSSVWRAPDQIIYPYMFGDPYSKDICLWLKNLPPLISTCVSPVRKPVSNHVNGRMSQDQKAKIKSRFFPLTASAMANQWS